VTAFLYAGLGGRPFWNSALLAPRFIVTAFVSGPAFVIVLLLLLARFGHIPVREGPIRTLTSIMRVTVVVNLFMLGSELFTSLYTGGAHASAIRYLFFGSHGRHALAPWIWTAVALNLGSVALLFAHKRTGKLRWLTVACVAAFCGIWIEKGMGLIIPGFVPSTLHEIVEYTPSLTEWRVTAGIWAFGLGVLTVALKVALPVLKGELRVEKIRVNKI
jgi:molybdopterin-containing oxidoreductase family membrane subunit